MKFGTMSWLSLRPELLPSWWRLGVVIAATIVVIVIVVPLFQTASNPDKQQSDFGVYYRAGEIVAQHRSPYTSEIGRYPYAYAPVFAYVAFQPLAKLPLRVGDAMLPAAERYLVVPLDLSLFAHGPRLGGLAV